MWEIRADGGGKVDSQRVSVNGLQVTSGKCHWAGIQERLKGSCSPLASCVAIPESSLGENVGWMLVVIVTEGMMLPC